MTPVVPSQTPRSRWRLQFSLLTLLLVAIIACVVAAYFGTARRLMEANATIELQRKELAARDSEIAKLEAELGKLTIKDPSKVHILALPSKQDWHWRWRVYLPPGKTWKITMALGEKVPLQGFDLKNVPHESSTGSESKSEFTAELWLERNVNGKLQLHRQIGGTRVASGISEQDAGKLVYGGSSRSHSAGTSSITELHDPSGPIEFLRLHKYASLPQSDGSTIDSTTPNFGILLFLEEAKMP